MQCCLDKPYCKGMCKLCYSRKYRKENKDRLNELGRIWYSQHKEKVAEWHKTWRTENKELAKELSKNWYINNKERKYQKHKEWKIKNPGKMTAIWASRRARKKTGYA